MDDFQHLLNLKVRAETCDPEPALQALAALGETLKEAAGEYDSAVTVFMEKGAAYTYVPVNALDAVRREGIFSGKLLSQRPDLLNLIADNRGEQHGEFADDFKANVARREASGWNHSDEGPSIFFKKPPVSSLPDNHPLKKWQLARVGIDLDRLRKEVPQTRVHGMELEPFSEEKYQQLGDDYATVRHRDLADKEYRRLARTSAAKLWQHYADTGGKYYAADVPHAAVITPTGKIDPQYLKFPAAKPKNQILAKLSNYDAPFTVACDFDGTLAETVEPFDPDVIGKPRKYARRALKAFKKAGARIIIWTVRGKLKPVEDWFKEHKIPYDYVNENPDQPEGASQKVIADVYLDDRAVSAVDLPRAAKQVLRMIRSAE